MQNRVSSESGVKDSRNELAVRSDTQLCKFVCIYGMYTR